MATENDIAIGVMRIAAGSTTGIATFKRCRLRIPQLVNLTADNLALSGTRPGELMWHQLVRNIKSHDQVEGNFIERGLLQHVPRVGYSITQLGRQWLHAQDLHP